MLNNKLEVSMYRYNPEVDKFPYMKTYSISKPSKDIMVLDLLNLLKEEDQSISYRRSCREGVCGSDGMNINGKNGLACITPISSVIKKNKIELRPLPGLPVIRDLVVDMSEFYAQYEKIKPFLQNETTAPEQERLQSPKIEISLMDFMSAFYAHAVLLAALHFGGILINLLDLQHCYKHIDFLLILVILKLMKG